MPQNKTIIITGAARGIGLATAEKFVKEGWSVALADVLVDTLFAEVERLKKAGADVEGYELDVTDFAKAGEVVKAVEARFGKVDALFNDAGIVGHRGNVLNFDPVEIKKATDVSVFGALNLIQHVANSIIAHGLKGAIVNVASVTAERASWDPLGYQLAKYGVKGVTQAAAFQLGRKGIRVNSVAPGFVKTEMSKIDWSNPAIKQNIEDGTTLGRILDPSEIANAVYFLVSDEASAITGFNLIVDAGFSTLKFSNKENIYGE